MDLVVAVCAESKGGGTATWKHGKRKMANPRHEPRFPRPGRVGPTAGVCFNSMLRERVAPLSLSTLQQANRHFASSRFDFSKGQTAGSWGVVRRGPRGALV